MRIDLSCPVELWQYAMPTESVSECTFVMNNLSDKVVTSVMVTLNCYDKLDQPLFRQSERIQGLKAGVGERFSFVILPSQWQGVEGMDLVVEKVWFDDASVWRRGNAPLTHYTPNTLSNGRALDHLRFVAGRDAMGYPQWQEEAWVCVCGRANALDSEHCCRCERGRDTVFASYNKENVDAIVAVRERKLSEDSKKVRQDNSRLNEEENKRRSAIKRKRRNRWRLVGVIGVALAVAAVAIFWGLPALQYNKANQLLQSGQYEKASEAFAAMGNFQDAQTQSVESLYLQAANLQKAGDAESLEKAVALYEQLGEYKDSATNHNAALYQLGQAYYNDQLFDKAADCFQRLGEYEDSADQLSQCVYAQADQLYQGAATLTASAAGDQLALAQALFATIADYSDAADRVRGCQYAQAKLSEDAGDDQQAAQLYLQAGNYEDAAERYVQCLYRTAVAAETNGDMENAGSLFMACGDYEDAAERAKACLYQHGCNQRDAGAYELAAEAFRRIPDYQDSQAQITDCVYHQAENAFNQGDYSSAVMLYRSVGDYEDALARLSECSYLLALESINKNDYQAAEVLLSSMDTSEENADQLVNVRYRLAEKAFEMGDYQKALDYYILLDNELYHGRMQEVYFKLGEKQMEAALYNDAIESFTLAGDVEGAKEALENAAAKLAETMETNNDLPGALTLATREDVPEAARKKAVALLMAEGQRLETSGDYAAAAQWYLDMNGLGESAKRYQHSLYQAALKQMENGEYQAAADQFALLGDYEDAATQAQSCYDALYSTVLAQAEESTKAKDYLSVIKQLMPLKETQLPKSYQKLHDLYLNACLDHAEALYDAGDRYGALPFYVEASELSAAKRKLGYRSYLILGVWESNTGKQAEFRADGTCNLMGKELYFRVDNFSLLTGSNPDDLTRTHRINSMTKRGMSIEELRGSSEVNFKLDKVAEATIPELSLVLAQQEAAPAEETNE